ncbi:hypothetical protein H0H81_000890, partial [Sphagnurus paluster]
VNNQWQWSKAHSANSWRRRYCTNAEEFDRRIRNYQRKHGISTALKREEDDDDGDEGGQDESTEDDDGDEVNQGDNSNEEEDYGGDSPVAPGKRKRQQGDQAKRSRIKRDSGPDNAKETKRETFVPGRGRPIPEEERPRHPPQAERDVHQATACPEEKQGNAQDLDNAVYANLEVDEQAYEPISESKSNKQAQPKDTVDEPPAPSLPSAAVQPPITHVAITHTLPPTQRPRPRAHVEPQPIASSSRVKLSPSHHISTELDFGPDLEPKATSINRRKKRKTQNDDDFFATSPDTPSPPGHAERTHGKHRMPSLTEGPFGQRFQMPKKRLTGNDNSSSDESEEVVPGGKGKLRAVTPVRKENGKAKELPVEKLLVPSQVLEKPVKILDEPDPEAPATEAEVSKLPRAPPLPTRMRSTTSLPNPQIPTRTSDNPFVTPSLHEESGPKKKMVRPNELVRRYTIETKQNEDLATGPRIDLRSEKTKHRVHSRGQSISTNASITTSNININGNASPTTTTSTDVRSRSSLLPIEVADEDRERIEYLGVSRAIEIMAKNFGFSEEAVWSAWQKLKNIARTEDYLRRLHEKVKAAEEAVLADMERDGVDLDRLDIEAEEGSLPVPVHNHQDPEPNRKSTSEPTITFGRSPGRRVQEKNLKIKPLPVERAMSDYVPPSTSRAGRFIRLVHEGRKDEALFREKRRASGASAKLGGTSLTSRTPQRGSPKVEGDDDIDKNRGGMRGEGSDQESDDASDDARNVEVYLQEEEQDSFLAASAANSAELRAIEQSIDPDHMMRWTAAMLGRLRDRMMTPPQ